MIKAILAIIGFTFICAHPTLCMIFIITVATIALSSTPTPKSCKEPATMRKPKEKELLSTDDPRFVAQVDKVREYFKKQKELEEATKGFTTIKERQEENIKRYLKPGFEKDPVWRAQTKELHKIMDENRRKEQAKRDAGDWS